MARSIVTVAQVCQRGHVVGLETRGPAPAFCTKCGGGVLTRCPACEKPIAGIPIESEDALGNLDYQWNRPGFCPDCGAAYPWADRQAGIYELQNRLDREDLDPGDALAAREALEALASAELPDEEQIKQWKRVRELAPGLWENSRGIITDLVTSYAKSKLRL